MHVISNIHGDVEELFHLCKCKSILLEQLIKKCKSILHFYKEIFSIFFFLNKKKCTHVVGDIHGDVEELLHLGLGEDGQASLGVHVARFVACGAAVDA